MLTFLKKIILSALVVFAVVAPQFASAQAGISASATVLPTAIFDTSVILSGTVADPDVLSLVVTYASNNLSPGGEVSSSIDLDGKFSVEITGLTPATTYSYQLFDAGSNRQLTTPLTFRTKSTLFNFRVEQVSETSATLYGTATSIRPDLRILWGEQGVTEYEHSFTPTIKGNRTFVETLVDLLPNTKYKVVLVKASDEKARLSGVYGFTTLGINASPYMGVIKATEATVNVRLPKELPEVYVYYGTKVDELSSQSRMKEEEPGLYVANLTGLSADTIYHYKIVGRDDTGAPVVYGSTSVIGTDEDGKPLFFGSMFSFRTAVVTTPITVRTIVDTVGSLVGNEPEYDGGLVPCTGVDDAGNVTCGFSDFLKMINTLIGFIVFYLVPAIATIIIMVAGFLLLTAGGNETKITTAKGMLKNVVIGIVIITGAWLLIKTVLIGMGYDSKIFPDVFTN